jgi:hypothetical protein
MEKFTPVFVLLGILLLRFALNQYKLFRVHVLQKRYKHYLFEENWEMGEDKQEIIQLFKDAGLKDSAVLHQEEMGYGRVSAMRVSAFENVLNRREDIVALITIKFHEAIGVYRKRAWESLNPFYWIEFIFKLPQHLLGFFGVLPENIAVKIFLVIYWLVVVLLGLQKFDLIKLLSK